MVRLDSIVIQNGPGNVTLPGRPKMTRGKGRKIYSVI